MNGIWIFAFGCLIIYTKVSQGLCFDAIQAPWKGIHNPGTEASLLSVAKPLNLRLLNQWSLDHNLWENIWWFTIIKASGLALLTSVQQSQMKRKIHMLFHVLGQQSLVSLRNILDAGDQSQVSSVHGKHPTHCTISLTSLILILWSI